MESEELHLDQARKFVAAQAKDPIEVAQAQARAANARSALAQAQSNAAVALANLRSAIGWVDPNVTFVVDSELADATRRRARRTCVTLVDCARARTGPRSSQLDKQIVAAEASVDAAEAQRRPVLSASARRSGTSGTGRLVARAIWNAGLTLSWQLYDGGRARLPRSGSRAPTCAGVIAQRDALLVSLTSQLDAARSQIVANRANVIASTEAVTAARAQLQLADARYTQGLGSQIELADAQSAVTTGRGQPDPRSGSSPTRGRSSAARSARPEQRLISRPAVPHLRERDVVAEADAEEPLRRGVHRGRVVRDLGDGVTRCALPRCLLPQRRVSARRDRDALGLAVGLEHRADLEAVGPAVDAELAHPLLRHAARHLRIELAARRRDEPQLDVAVR